MHFHSSILTPNLQKREPVIQILDAALDAVDPYRAVLNALHVHNGVMHVGEGQYVLDEYKRIFVLGAGKAGAPMTQAIETLLGERITDGLVVTKTDHGGPTRFVQLVEASHPVPDEAGVEAGRKILKLAQNAGERDLVITLISGGGSALLVAPAVGLTLDDLQVMTDALLACGATINEMNCLRKHCSAIKGGQLAAAASPATLVTLVLSDVVGNPLDVIASGPTVPDETTWRDAWTIIEKYGLVEQLPLPILGRIQAGLHGKVAETPKPGADIFAHSQTAIVADNRIAAQAAQTKARALGFNTLLLTTYLQGEAKEVAKVAVSLAREARASGQPVAAPACIILGGETTVRLGEAPGQGGRNQELALAAALDMQGMKDVMVAALATDGTDGPTDSAGGLVDGDTVRRGQQKGLRAADFLARHDAYPFLEDVSDLLVTGPTQTNVNDLLLIFVL